MGDNIIKDNLKMDSIPATITLLRAQGHIAAAVGPQEPQACPQSGTLQKLRVVIAFHIDAVSSCSSQSFFLFFSVLFSFCLFVCFCFFRDRVSFV